VYARRKLGSTPSKIIKAPPTTPPVARIRSSAFGASVSRGAVERMPSTQTMTIRHRFHRLSLHSPAAATRPVTPSTTLR
jgi:hypothetical protein